MKRSMPTDAMVLLNTPRIEAWPGGLLRARGSHDARLLSGARHVLRRKRDGCYLAVVDEAGALAPLRPAFAHEPGLSQALDAIAHAGTHRRNGIDTVPALPLDRLRERLETLGLDEGYGERTGLALAAEPAWLALAGFDRFRRPLWLRADAARGWKAMQSDALREGVVLEAVSGYRSHDYQLGIFERKLARGQSVAEILTVNAAPGYSEHHGGTALDIGTPGEPAAEESFEATAAFAWLQANAAGHGFALSYPRGNPHGIAYEPWHWAYRP